MQVKTEASHVLAWLRAAGEPTRLRLLALCAQREFAVSDLALVVGQSGPRVSRHLKILCAAGLLSRLRAGQWVHYRLSQEPAAARFLEGLLADLDPSDPLLAPDRTRVRAAGISSDEDAAHKLAEALATFMRVSAGRERCGRMVVIGTAHPMLLASAIDVADECTVLAQGRRAAQAVNAFIKREHLMCRVLSIAIGEPLEAVLAQGSQFDALVLDRSQVASMPLAPSLAACGRILTSAGRLWLFERYPSSEDPSAARSSRPLVQLRQALHEAGFACERLSPIRAEREHVLAAIAVPARALTAASVA